VSRQVAQHLIKETVTSCTSRYSLSYSSSKARINTN